MGAALGVVALAYPALPTRWAPLAILVVLFPFVALVSGSLKNLLLAAIVFDASLQLDIYLGPPEQASVYGLQAFIVSMTSVGIAALYAQWLAERAMTRRTAPRAPLRSKVVLALTAYFVVSALSLIVARDIRMSLYQMVLLAQMYLLFLYVAVRVTTRRQVLFIVRVFLLSAILEGLLMIAVFFLGHDIGAAGITAVVADGGRVAGTTGSFNRAASFLNLMLMLGLGVLLSRLGRADKVLAAIAVCVSGPALVLTLSRGGWIGFLISLSLVLVAAARRGRVRPGVLLFVLVGLTSLFFAFRPMIANRVEGVDASPVEVRVQLMRMAANMIRDHPLRGVGENNYGLVLKDYLTPEFAGTWVHEVHNKYLLVWAETGVFGLAAFVLFLVAAIAEAWWCWRRGNDDLSFVALGLGAGVVAHMAQMFTERFVSRSQIQSLWLVVGLIVAISQLLRAPSSADTEDRAGPGHRRTPAPSVPTRGTGHDDAA